MNNDVSRCVLVRELARIAADRTTRRKLLVARSRTEGRELLRQLTLGGQSWAGIEVTTIRPLALEVAAARLASDGLRVVDEFDFQAMAEHAIDDTVKQAERANIHNLAPTSFLALADRIGFRDSVRQMVELLRRAGIGPKAGNKNTDNRVTFVLAVLDRYCQILRENNCTDTAGVLRRAWQALTDNSWKPPEGQTIYFLPGHENRGLSGNFLTTLQEKGAMVLKTDPVECLPVPNGMKRFWNAAAPEAAASYLHAIGASTSPEPAIPTPQQDKPFDLFSAVVDPTPAAEPAPSDGQAAPIRWEKLNLFTAASVYDELRGVIRRIIALGARWDQVEIVTPKPALYGSALNAIALPLGIPVTFAVGLPVERSRPGRVVSAYFRWVKDGFREPEIRALIEAEDIKPPEPHHQIDGPRLARALRRLRIGWGRKRYLTAINNALAQVDRRTPGRFENEEEFLKGQSRAREELRALRALLTPVLAATPGAKSEVSPSEVATGVKSLLAFVARKWETTDGLTVSQFASEEMPHRGRDKGKDDTDYTATERLTRRLNRIEATLGSRKTNLASALAIAQGFLKIGVPAPAEDGSAPWGSAPGHIYLTDIHHGGMTGRRFTFLVGMDASALPAAHEDPLLLDSDRRQLDKMGTLPLAKDGFAEARFHFASLFARLRRNVTVSYPCWDPAELRVLAPASEVLQAFRLREGDPTLTFEDLERGLGDAESRLPRRAKRDRGQPVADRPRNEPVAEMDRSDVWLRALNAGDGRLRNGLAAVGRAYPDLGRGRFATLALQTKEAKATVHAGILGTGSPPRSYEELSKQIFSASSLGNLGACPRRFLLRHVLRAYAPDEPSFDPGRWLDALRRGNLLHKVYEKTLRRAKANDITPDEEGFQDLAKRILEREIKDELTRTPTPSDLVQKLESVQLWDDVKSFVEMVRDQKVPWKDLEWRFGQDGGMAIQVDGEEVRIRGGVDRIDDHHDHLRVIDYKTGKTTPFDPKTGVYDGGRRFQHFVYQVACGAEAGRPVDAMEYHFPTRRGENQVISFGAAQLEDGGSLIQVMMEGLRKGYFPATNEPEKDCRFCDYQEACGVQDRGRRPSLDNPLSAWTKCNLGTLPELSPLKKVREWEKR